MGDGFPNVPSGFSRVAEPAGVTRVRLPWWRWRPRWRLHLPAWTSSLEFHLVLLALTLLSTVGAGTEIAFNCSRHRPAFSLDLSFVFSRGLWLHPSRLALGLPFSLTLLTILLAHELGHYLACRYYRLSASYPYFIPAPTLIGTFGAFIRIRSAILTRRILFDVAVAGPIAGFVLAIPALAFGVLHAQPGPVSAAGNAITPGTPLALVLLAHWLRPGLSAAKLALPPVGCAAWVGLFATALNLLPIGQLDGGHILYTAIGRWHKLLSRGFAVALLPLGYYCWPDWYFWAGVLLIIGTGHPPVVFPEEALGRPRKALLAVAAAMLVLCFVPTPFTLS